MRVDQTFLSLAKFTLRESVLAFHDRLERALVHFSVLSLVLLDDRQQIEGTLSDENDLTIFDTSIVILSLHDATLPDSHRGELIVTTNVDVLLSLGLEGHDRTVVEFGGELDVVGVTSMWQACRTIERLMP